MTPEQDYRARAGVFEQMAKEASSEAMRQDHLRLAAEYRTLADAVSGKKRTGRWG
jgi:hypothetical protein